MKTLKESRSGIAHAVTRVDRHGGIGSKPQRSPHLVATASRVTTPVRITLFRKHSNNSTYIL